jgi:hypothetical protein
MYLQDLAEADAPKELIQSVQVRGGWVPEAGAVRGGRRRWPPRPAACSRGRPAPPRPRPRPQEFYGDFMALDAHHFVIPVAGADLLINPHATLRGGAPSEYEVVDRLVQGLSGLFLALRRRPVIRYQRNSEPARRLAESLYSLTYKQQARAAGRGRRGVGVGACDCGCRFDQARRLARGQRRHSAALTRALLPHPGPLAPRSPCSISAATARARSSCCWTAATTP